jgi:hypothetical protein
VLRGGSWNNNQRNARCAYRNRNNPDNFNNNIGFRVVFSHNLSCHTPTDRHCALSPPASLGVDGRRGLTEKLAQSIPG